jgi:TrmH family RNA methyltransferase
MSRPKQITSPSNPLWKDLRRAVARGERTSDGLLIAETFHLLDEALRSRLEVPLVIASAAAQGAVEQRIGSRPDGRLVIAADSLFPQITGVEAAQGVIALVRPREWELADLFTELPLVVVLDGLRDPGNAGAIVRAAEAFGASGVVFLKGTVSAYNTKTLRASAGSLFRLPYVTGLTAESLQAALRRRTLRLYAAVPSGGLPLPQADLRSPAAVVIGSEAHGVSPSFRQAAVHLSIPTRGVESLNAALAAAIVLYEASRQRDLA